MLFVSVLSTAPWTLLTVPILATPTGDAGPSMLFAADRLARGPAPLTLVSFGGYRAVLLPVVHLRAISSRCRYGRMAGGRTKAMVVMRTIYEDPQARSHGRAQLLSRGREGATGEDAAIYRMSEALYQSLFQLGILSRFATRLPNNGWLDMAEEGILFHEGFARRRAAASSPRGMRHGQHV